jgi:hypothetical protein
LKEGEKGFDQNKADMNGKPICTKYTLDTKSCNYVSSYFNVQIGKNQQMPPEKVSSKLNSDFIVKNLEIYFCKVNNNVIIATGKFLH